MINGQIINEELHDDKEVITQESLQPKRINPDEKAYQSVRDIKERLHHTAIQICVYTFEFGRKGTYFITLYSPLRNLSHLIFLVIGSFDFQINDATPTIKSAGTNPQNLESSDS